jgi:hypothetical protein
MQVSKYPNVVLWTFGGYKRFKKRRRKSSGRAFERDGKQSGKS